MSDDLQSTLDAIDQVAVDECSWCRATLSADAPSSDFCNADCQTAWTRQQQDIVELVGYREPTDLAAHVNNQVEYTSPETTPNGAGPGGCRCFFCRMRESLRAVAPPRVVLGDSVRVRPGGQVFVGRPDADPTDNGAWQSVGWLDELPAWTRASEPAPAAAVTGPVVLGWDPAGGSIVAVRSNRGQVSIDVVFDIQPMSEALARMVDSMRRAGLALTTWQERTLGALEQARALRTRLDLTPRTQQPRQPAPAQRPDPIDQLPEPMRRALELRRNRNTGPTPRRRPPRRINPHGGTW